MNFNFEQANTLWSDWWKRQQVAFQSMTPQFDQTDAMHQGAELWRSYMEFWTTLSKILPPQAGASESAMESLVAPAAGVPTGSGLEDLVGRLNEGPGFATLWDWDRKSLGAYSAWLEMRQAAAVHRAILDQAWQEAYKRFIAALAKPVADNQSAVKSWRQGSELWFDIANQCLLETQRSDAFLEAQRHLLRAAMDYRLRLRELSEEFCEINQIPGRGEVDELARLVHELRREVRELKRRTADIPASAASNPAPALFQAPKE